MLLGITEKKCEITLTVWVVKYLNHMQVIECTPKPHTLINQKLSQLHIVLATKHKTI